MFRVNNRFRRIRSKSKLNRPRLVFEIERQLFAVAVMHILNHQNSCVGQRLQRVSVLDRHI